MNDNDDVNPELQSAYDAFMRLLYDDVARTMGGNSAFQIKTTIQMGVLNEQDIVKIQKYQPTLQKLLDSTPKLFTPSPVVVNK